MSAVAYPLMGNKNLSKRPPGHVSRTARAHRRGRELREMGLRMALDDFGTDYSVQAAADRRIEPLFKPL